jgi:hypothetical protein
MDRDAHRLRVVRIMAAAHDHFGRCKEGTRRVPKGITACCATVESHTTACQFDRRYEWRGPKRGWHLMISDEAGVTIAFCPDCGKKL